MWGQIGLGLGEMGLKYWLGRQRQKRESRLSPAAQKILADLFAEYKSGEAPAGVTAPFVQGAKNIQQEFSRRPGETGTEHGLLQREAYTPMAEAVSKYRKGLRAQIAQILSGTGTQEIETGPDVSAILGEGIGDIAYGLGLTGELEGEDEETTGAGGGFPTFGQDFGQEIDLNQLSTILGGSPEKRRWSRSSLRLRPNRPNRRRSGFSFAR